MRNLNKGLFLVAIMASSVSLVACGGGGSAASNFSSMEDIQKAMENPTGTVDATTVKSIGTETQNALLGASAGASGGIRQKQQAASVSIDCPEGGALKSEGDSSKVKVTYDSCVISACTVNGSGQIFHSSGGPATNFCATLDVDIACSGVGAEASASASGSYCVAVDTSTMAMSMTYLVAVDGKTFTVSGFYSEGDGELKITGANGSFTCTYADGKGSCTGEGSAEFSF